VISPVELILSQAVLQIFDLPLEHCVLLEGAVFPNGFLLVTLFSLDSVAQLCKNFKDFIRIRQLSLKVLQGHRIHLIKHVDDSIGLSSVSFDEELPDFLIACLGLTTLDCKHFKHGNLFMDACIQVFKQFLNVY